MTTTEPVQDKNAWSRSIKAIRHAVVNWGVRIAIAVMATIIILSHVDYFKEYIKAPTDQLLIVLVLVFGGGGGYYGHTRWGPGGGAGVGLGTILLILLIVYLPGGLR